MIDLDLPDTKAYLKIEPNLGSDIKDSLSAALIHSLKHDLPVKFIFNGVKVEVLGSQVINQFVDKYRAALGEPGVTRFMWGMEAKK